MITSKKAMEWYIILGLILLIISAIFIVGYVTGAFTKLGAIGGKSLFGWLDFGK